MKRYILLAAAALATGCSSTPEQPPVFSESLITNISDQGNHFFTYKAQLSADQEGGMGGGGGRRGGRGGGPGGGGMEGGPGGGAGGKGGGTMAKMRDNAQEAAMERLEELLAESGYCPNGWFIIEKTFDRGSAEIRGECRASSG